MPPATGPEILPGRIVVFRPDLPARIEWHCNSCGDEGVISAWEGSYFDLRAPRPRRPDGTVADIVVPEEVAAALRDVLLLDPDCERLVYQARVTDDGIVLSADGTSSTSYLGSWPRKPTTNPTADASSRSRLRRAQRRAPDDGVLIATLPMTLDRLRAGAGDAG